MNEVLVNLTDEARWWMLVGIVMGALLYVSWRQDVDGKRFDPKPRMLIDPHLDKGELSQYHIDLVVKRKWKEILALIVFEPDELFRKDRTGQTILHHACLFRAPAQVIQMLLWQCPQLASVTNSEGECPLHWAVRLSAPLEHLQSLLDACPESGSEIRDRDGNSPLSLLWDRHRESIVAQFWEYRDKVTDLTAWKRILLFFPSQSIHAHQDKYGHTPTLLHVASTRQLPPGLFPLMLDMFASDIMTPDSMGRLPLHYACLHPHANRYSEITSKIQLLLEAGGTTMCLHSDHRSTTNGGRLPLHYALDSGITWREGVQDLLDAHPSHLRYRDPVTALPPFLLAAASRPKDDTHKALMDKTQTSPHQKQEQKTPATLLMRLSYDSPMPLYRGDRRRLPWSYPGGGKSLATIYQILRKDPSQLTELL